MNKRLLAVVLLTLTFGHTVTGYAEEEKPPLNVLRIT